MSATCSLCGEPPHALAECPACWDSLRTRAELMLARRENANLRENLGELLIVAKSWQLVWQDKFSPKSLAAFAAVEQRILNQK